MLATTREAQGSVANPGPSAAARPPAAEDAIASLEVHLIVERGSEGAVAARGSAVSAPLALPCSPAFLGTDNLGNPRVSSQRDLGPQGAIVIAPVRNRAGQPRLLLLHEDAGLVQVNGHAVPRVALLKELDVLQWASGFQVHVALFGRPGQGAPPGRWVGRDCPHCRTPFAEAARCLVCAWCGTPLHDEREAGGLRCAQERAVCPGCSRPLLRSAGYSGLPDLER